ncbi:MAG: hypothetical protein WDW38_001191 [Sanguina aurantia]
MASADDVHPRASAILDYWLSDSWKSAAWDAFPEEKKMQWFSGTPAVDASIRELFAKDLEDVVAGKLDAWLSNPHNTLAGVILMDQFARNIHRGSPASFACGDKCMAWAATALDSGKADSLPVIHRLWLSMPFDHSENVKDQERCVALQQACLAEVKGKGGANPALLAYMEMACAFGVRHQQVIARWGRFPHRNAILGRASTDEEAAGLADGSIPRF